MRKTSSLTILALCIWLPQAASAKAPTVRITVSGVGLARSIEITDPRILDLSRSWGSAFLDASRQPLDQAPPGQAPYEVSFYFLIGHDVRKTCVVYYYPGVSNDPGLLYLPGNGTAWGLNVGTILRRGQDGKWNHASPAWDALMKDAIARAESGAALSRPSQVAIDHWTTPRTGWLYTLDTQSGSDHPSARVWLLDPESGKVMGSIRAGDQPDIALSPDGARLYIASGERETGELSVIDTGNGAIRHVPFPNRVLYTPWYATLPPFASMTLSVDGGALRILAPKPFPPEKAESQVFTFDTASLRFLPAAVSLGTCGGLAGFVPASTAAQFDVLCDADNTLHSIQVDASYRETSNRIVQLPGARHCPAATGFWSADKSSLALIRHDGTIDQMDRATQKFHPTGVTGECVAPWVVFSLEWPRSPDGARVYVGYGPPTPDNLATSNQFRVFDTASWKQLGSVQTSVPFWSAAVSADGALIYAPAPLAHGILVIDAATLQEQRTIPIGTTPALAIVSP
jgi:hypothetical protein